MKYGYLFYQKPLIPEMKTRPVNIGDAIQSLAAKNLYREMGIPEEDIIPVPRYDISEYDGDECICVVNSASNYEELAYDSHFMPPSPKVHAIPMSLHIHRPLTEEELEFYRTCGGVGCRDIYTVNYLQSLGIDAYLTGCLTLTLPRRTKEQEEGADQIYFIDISEDLKDYIPKKIAQNAVTLTNIQRYANPGNTNRMPVEDACEEHRQGENRIQLLRDTAKLVVTTKLHVACPCLAMGIPVILAKDYFGDRFGFLDRLLPTYTRRYYRDIDWNPQPVNIEKEKEMIKQLFFHKVLAQAHRVELKTMWEGKTPIYPIEYETGTTVALGKLSFPTASFKYAVWGVILSAAYYLEEAVSREYGNADLVCGIDIAATGSFCGVPVISPEKIEALDKDVIIFVAAPSAHASAKQLLLPAGRPFVLLKGTDAECFNWR
ncbi:MAG: polysaccharide pyruvyl transferase family protein [Clostridium sp.]|nr:polysaccharide pyruvyl transferase family protein [Clostridium sp.]